MLKGASLVQFYTAFAYEASIRLCLVLFQLEMRDQGPVLVSSVKKELSSLLAADGFEVQFLVEVIVLTSISPQHVHEAVGLDRKSTRLNSSHT